jgi:hypothetical protein
MNILEDLKSQFKKMVVHNKINFFGILLCLLVLFSFGLLELVFRLTTCLMLSLSSNPLDLLGNMVAANLCFFHVELFHILFNLVVLNFVGRLFNFYPKQF